MGLNLPTPINFTFSPSFNLQLGIGTSTYIGNGSTGLIGGVSIKDAINLKFKICFEGTDNELRFLVHAQNENDYVGNTSNNGLVMGVGFSEATCFYTVRQENSNICIYTADNTNAVVNLAGIGLGLGDPSSANQFIQL